MDSSERKQASHPPEALHGPLSSSKWQVGILRKKGRDGAGPTAVGRLLT
jgi:hypothetical protein